MGQRHSGQQRSVSTLSHSPICCELTTLGIGTAACSTNTFRRRAQRRSCAGPRHGANRPIHLVVRLPPIRPSTDNKYRPSCASYRVILHKHYHRYHYHYRHKRECHTRSTPSRALMTSTTSFQSRIAPIPVSPHASSFATGTSTCTQPPRSTPHCSKTPKCVRVTG